ncbi:hypothetical protein CR513_42383, partial [Mucuna pruriens]
MLGPNLVSWTNKRQGTIALSTTKVEYISIAQCCSQLQWIKHQLEDYDIFVSYIPLFCDNTTAINLSKNPILHSRAKHIEIKHYFIRHYKISDLLLSISTKSYFLLPLHINPPLPLQTIIHTTLDIFERSPSSPIQPTVQTLLDDPTQITVQTLLDDPIIWTPLILSPSLKRNDQSFSFNNLSLKTYPPRPDYPLPIYTFKQVPLPLYLLLATYLPPEPATPHPWETLFQAYLHPLEPLTSPYKQPLPSPNP